MADNVPITSGTGTSVATDDIGGVQYQRVKNVFGADGVATDVSVTNPMPVGGGFISTVNSTTTVLAAAAVFTGTSEDISQYSSIYVNVFASHVSATDGLQLQQSMDNTNWDNVDAYTVPAATGKTFSVKPGSRYFRVVYTNGATLQTSFRLQTIFKYTATRGSSVRPQDARTNDNDMEEVLGHLMGYNPIANDWHRLRTTGGALQVVTQPATLAVTATAAAAAAVTLTLPAAGAGLFHYITRINIDKYATAAITGTATPVTVTSTNLPGSVAWTFPTAAAIGTTVEENLESDSPFKSSVANTATTIVCPATASTIWRVTVYYYTGA